MTFEGAEKMRARNIKRNKRKWVSIGNKEDSLKGGIGKGVEIGLQERRGKLTTGTVRRMKRGEKVLTDSGEPRNANRAVNLRKKGKEGQTAGLKLENETSGGGKNGERAPNRKRNGKFGWQARQ